MGSAGAIGSDGGACGMGSNWEIGPAGRRGAAGAAGATGRAGATGGTVSGTRVGAGAGDWVCGLPGAASRNMAISGNARAVVTTVRSFMGHFPSCGIDEAGGEWSGIESLVVSDPSALGVNEWPLGTRDKLVAGKG